MRIGGRHAIRESQWRWNELTTERQPITRIRLTGHSVLQSVDHIPEPIDFAAFDDLHRLQAAKGLVRGHEPRGDSPRLDHFGKSLVQSSCLSVRPLQLGDVTLLTLDS